MLQTVYVIIIACHSPPGGSLAQLGHGIGTQGAVVIGVQEAI